MSSKIVKRINRARRRAKSMRLQRWNGVPFHNPRTQVHITTPLGVDQLHTVLEMLRGPARGPR
jgi:hypothetical protein